MYEERKTMPYIMFYKDFESGQSGPELTVQEHAAETRTDLIEKMKTCLTATV